MSGESTINRIVMLMLPLFGIWPGKSMNLISRMFWIVSLGFIALCHFIYFFTHFNSQNFFNLIDCMASFLAYAKVFVKLVMFWKNERKFVEMLALITDDWNDSTDSDINMRVTMRKAKLSSRITNAILVLHTMCIVGFCFGVIIADTDITDQTIVDLPFANKMTLPFSVNRQNTYRFILISEFVHMLFSNLLIGVINAILLALVLHLGAQVEILQNWLSQLVPKEIGITEESIVTLTNKVIQKHNKIIQFSENIETLFTHISLFLFASNTILICSIAFLIVSSLGTPDAVKQIMKCLLFFSDTNLEAFIFCFAGEYLSNKCEAIGFAIYNCPWYNMSTKDMRILLFIIVRSQKRLTLTAGKMMILSLNSFTTIMNASGSYLSVLLTMHE